MKRLTNLKLYWISLFKSSVDREYLFKQKERSISKSGKNEFESNRRNYLVNLLSKKIDLTKIKSALVIGCRNSEELDLLETKGVKKVLGADLFSFDKRIKIMDMHRLKFKNNSFDLVYASHSLEHAKDYKKAMNEILRVIKPDGYVLIEVPVNYETTWCDINDFKNFESIEKIFSELNNGGIKILHAEDLKKEEENNFGNTDISRFIIQINKN